MFVNNVLKIIKQNYDKSLITIVFLAKVSKNFRNNDNEYDYLM